LQSPPPILDVSRFDAEHHPEFRSIKSDNRKLKFSAAAHHLHLTAGLAADAKHHPVMTVGMLSAPDKARYMLPGQSDSSLIQLSCGSCHQSNGHDFSSDKAAGISAAAPGAHSSGDYMAPIVYETQCRACHPLAIDPANETKVGSNAAGDVVPHRLQPAQLAKYVRRFWEDQYLHDHPEQTERSLPLPGHAKQPEDQEAGQWIDRNMTGSMNHLRITCLKCHEFADAASAKPAASGSTSDELTDFLLPPVLSVHVPHAWFEYAKFDHSAHRNVNCRDCHAGAYPTELAETTAQTSAAPMIPNREKCVECHSPRQETSEPPRGGARFDCVECHRFHSRGEPSVP
jgi:hypothetical protein